MGKKLKELSALEQDLLVLLEERSLYGLEFVLAFRKASDGERELGFGSLYPTLARMEKKNLVTWRSVDAPAGPKRKYYSITPLGKAALEETRQFRHALKEWVMDSATDAETIEVEEQPAEITRVSR